MIVKAQTQVLNATLKFYAGTEEIADHIKSGGRNGTKIVK